MNDLEGLIEQLKRSIELNSRYEKLTAELVEMVRQRDEMIASLGVKTNLTVH